jgi:cytochrome c-type biogenesis protein CcmE
MKPRQKRAAIIGGGLAALALAAYFVLNAFESNLVFFFTPSQIASGEAPKNRTFRVGGMVREGSIKRDNLTVSFIVTDSVKEVSVSYTGILPDLFKEGKGVVAQGKLGNDGHFVASEVLAKHDENYMPPEAQHALDEAKAQQTIKTLK